MKAAKFVVAGLLATAIIVLGYYLMRPGSGGAIALVDAVAGPIAGTDGAVAIYLRIENPAGPDRIVGASSAQAVSAALVSPLNRPLEIPAASTPALSEDGSHVRLDGIEGALEDGRLIPVTLQFERAGALSTRAVVKHSHAHEMAAGTEAGMFGMHSFERVPDGAPVPELRLNLRPRGKGWSLELVSHDFTFSREQANGPHVPGVGHGHLYVDGVKLQRIFEPKVDIGELTPGEHEIRVTLVTNDHRIYLAGDEPLSAAATVTAK